MRACVWVGERKREKERERELIGQRERKGMYIVSLLLERTMRVN